MDKINLPLAKAALKGLQASVSALARMEAEIVYERGDYWVCKADKGFKVFRKGITHSERCGIVGFEGERGLKRAIEMIDTHEARDRAKKAVAPASPKRAKSVADVGMASLFTALLPA